MKSVYKFDCIISFLKIDRVTIYSANYLGIVTSKIWMAICSRRNGEEKRTTFPFPKVKPPWNWNSILKWQVFKNLFHSFQSFTKCFCCRISQLMIVANEGWIAWKCFKSLSSVFAVIAVISQILFIFEICQISLLKIQPSLLLIPEY